MIKTISLTTLTCIATLTLTYGQGNGYPEVGKQIPPFSLKTSKEKKDPPITESTLKGKHFILDFWSTGCVTCIKSFPKMNSLELKYRNDLKIILVGLEEKKRNIEDFYDFYKRKFGLKISSVFDSITFNKFVPRFVPHLIWVNDVGVIKAITGAEEVNEENIKKFIKNQDFPFFDVSYSATQKEGTSFDKSKPLLIDGNGGSDTSYLFRSVFSYWIQGKGSPYFPAIFPYKDSDICRYQVIGTPIDILYILAYFGAVKESPDTYIDPQFSPRAIEKIRRRFGIDRKFNYSQEIPREVATVESMMNKMQGDLASFFGLKARITTQLLPCYNLIMTDSDELSAITVKPGKMESSWAIEKKIQSFKNMPLDYVIKILKSKIISSKRLIVYNKTGTNVSVTFDMTADINDLESIRKGLRGTGLDLIPSTKLMQMIEVTEGP